MYAIHWLLTNPLYSHHSTDSEVDTKHPQSRGGHHQNIQGETPASGTWPRCDTLGCNVHTQTRNEWPKWLCGEYECALLSIVRPFTWYTLYHYYWYAASYGTIRVNQVVRKRYQCFVRRLGWWRGQWRHWSQSRGKHVASVGSQTLLTRALKMGHRCTSNSCLQKS